MVSYRIGNRLLFSITHEVTRHLCNGDMNGGFEVMQKQIWEWTGYNAMTTRTIEREISLEEDQVEVRIKSIGICGTDLHIMGGLAGFSQPPLPLGHELAGVVE